MINLILIIFAFVMILGTVAFLGATNTGQQTNNKFISTQTKIYIKEYIKKYKRKLVISIVITGVIFLLWLLPKIM